eukprot:m.134747 g.134747  ORF g.134747 m.134747 type:complete len:1037 (+) comp15978_c0_seq3:116-3226(+)
MADPEPAKAAGAQAPNGTQKGRASKNTKQNGNKPAANGNGPKPKQRATSNVNQDGSGDQPKVSKGRGKGQQRNSKSSKPAANQDDTAAAAPQPHAVTDSAIPTIDQPSNEPRKTGKPDKPDKTNKATKADKNTKRRSKGKKAASSTAIFANDDHHDHATSFRAKATKRQAEAKTRASGSLSPVGSSTPAADCVGVLSNRLRALRKRMTKVNELEARLEANPALALEEEQLVQLRNKDQLQKTLLELTSLKTRLDEVVAKELAEQQAREVRQVAQAEAQLQRDAALTQDVVAKMLQLMHAVRVFNNGQLTLSPAANTPFQALAEAVNVSSQNAASLATAVETCQAYLTGFESLPEDLSTHMPFVVDLMWANKAVPAYVAAQPSKAKASSAASPTPDADSAVQPSPDQPTQPQPDQPTVSGGDEAPKSPNKQAKRKAKNAKRKNKAKRTDTETPQSPEKTETSDPSKGKAKESSGSKDKNQDTSVASVLLPESLRNVAQPEVTLSFGMVEPEAPAALATTTPSAAATPVAPTEDIFTLPALQPMDTDPSAGPSAADTQQLQALDPAIVSIAAQAAAPSSSERSHMSALMAASNNGSKSSLSQEEQRLESYAPTTSTNPAVATPVAPEEVVVKELAPVTTSEPTPVAKSAAINDGSEQYYHSFGTNTSAATLTKDTPSLPSATLDHSHADYVSHSDDLPFASGEPGTSEFQRQPFATDADEMVPDGFGPASYQQYASHGRFEGEASEQEYTSQPAYGHATAQQEEAYAQQPSTDNLQPQGQEFGSGHGYPAQATNGHQQNVPYMAYPQGYTPAAPMHPHQVPHANPPPGFHPDSEPDGSHEHDYQPNSSDGDASSTNAGLQGEQGSEINGVGHQAYGPGQGVGFGYPMHNGSAGFPTMHMSPQMMMQFMAFQHMQQQQQQQHPATAFPQAGHGAPPPGMDTPTAPPMMPIPMNMHQMAQMHFQHRMQQGAQGYHSQAQPQPQQTSKAARPQPQAGHAPRHHQPRPAQGAQETEGQQRFARPQHAYAPTTSQAPAHSQSY